MHGAAELKAWRSGPLTGHLNMYIIIFTQQASWNETAYGQKIPRSQGSRPPAPGRLASSPRARHRRLVCDSRVFRSPRLGAGQVRNAATRATRGTRREPIGGGLWLLAPHLLSGASGLPAGRAARAHATEARAKGCPQVDRRRARVRPSGASGRSLSAPRRAGVTRQGSVRRHGPSPEHRARFGAPSKKTAVTEPLAPPGLDEDFVVRYEQLREDALGPHRASGVGFTLFLRQGMAGGYRACSRPAPPPAPSAAPAIAGPWSCGVRGQAAAVLSGILLRYPCVAPACTLP